MFPRSLAGPREPLLTRLAGARFALGTATAVPASQEGYESVPGVAGLEIPFTQASKSVWEEGPFWTGIKAGEADQILEPKGVPANGYLRHLLIKVETETEGSAGTGEGLLDWPWTIFRTIKFEDQGGHEIYGPLSGFAAYLACKWGGYLARPDMAELPTFNKEVQKPNVTFFLPIEIAPTGLGALSNMTEATQYHLALTVASLTGQYKKNPTTAPTLRIRTWVRLWPLPQGRTEPEPGAPEGRVQQQRPPLLGTVQYWTEQPSIKVAIGQNRVVFNRVGQMIRTHILVTRNTSGERIGTVLGNPVQMDWARVRFRTLDREVIRDMAFASVPGSVKEDLGVYPLIYSMGEQRYAGANEVNEWLATVNTTSLALNMANWEEGTLGIITNDVAVAAVGEQGRREVPGQTAEREPRMME